MEWDKGPPPASVQIFYDAPRDEYAARLKMCRREWGPLRRHSPPSSHDTPFQVEENAA